MGSPKMVLAELDFTQEADTPLKKNKKKNKKNGFIAPPSINVKESDDSDIVTPYQNGHYLNPVTEYAYNNRRPSRARLRHSVSSELEDLEDSQQLKLNSYSPDRNNYLSPLPPPLLVENERVGQVHSSLSNAITVAPSRTNLNESNVFAGGRPTNANNLKRHNHHRNNRLNRHKGRSRTPDFGTSNKLRLNAEHEDHCDILSKIDLSIKNKFGDWDSADEGEVEIAKKYLNGHTKSNNLDKEDKRPYFIPKSMAVSDSNLILESKDDLNLPRLYKPYESVVATSRQVLNDKTYQICLSKDNADPNSILSQAKKTLSLVGGGQS